MEFNNAYKNKNKSVKKKRARIVRFCRVGMALRHIHIHDYTPTEISKCCYSKKEKEATRQDITNDISKMRRMMNKNDVDVDMGAAAKDVCRRGVECHMREAAKERRHRKKRSSRAVLVEQMMQFDEGSDDPEYIAYVYIRACAQSRLDAYRRGLQDALDAWEETEE